MLKLWFSARGSFSLPHATPGGIQQSLKTFRCVTGASGCWGAHSTRKPRVLSVCQNDRQGSPFPAQAGTVQPPCKRGKAEKPLLQGRAADTELGTSASPHTCLLWGEQQAWGARFPSWFLRKRGTAELSRGRYELLALAGSVRQEYEERDHTDRYRRKGCPRALSLWLWTPENETQVPGTLRSHALPLKGGNPSTLVYGASFRWGMSQISALCHTAELAQKMKIPGKKCLGLCT